MHVLYFEPNLKGHRLEYLHHFYTLAVRNQDHHFTFVIPGSFCELKKMWEWPETNNVSFDFIDSALCDKELENGSTLDLLKKSWHLYAILDSYVKKNRPDYVFAVSLMHYIPFAAFLSFRNVKVSGIIYKIYIHETAGRISKTINWAKFKIMSCLKTFDKVFILNDKQGCDQLNKNFKTDKFLFLPDPYTPIETDGIIDFRKQYDISADKVLFAHFGGLQLRKGTMDILDSIVSLTKEECSKYSFVFAGKIYPDIRKQFYEKLDSLANKTQIIVIDEFCDYKLLASLCKACDAILMPYHKVAQSSGLIGYASQFKKPVIGPNGGLLGSIIQEYRLGFQIDKPYVVHLGNAYQKVADGEVPSPTDYYCQNNNVNSFLNSIVQGII